MRRLASMVVLGLAMAACAGPPRGMFGAVRRVGVDGKLSAAVAEKDLSPMQQLLRREFGAGAGKGNGGASAVMALEVDVPLGTGNEGDYLVIVEHAGTGGAELRYYEQSEHRPRVDRYFRREMSAEEVASWHAFMAGHRLADLPVVQPVGVDGGQGDSETRGQDETAGAGVPGTAAATSESGPATEPEAETKPANDAAATTEAPGAASTTAATQKDDATTPKDDTTTQKGDAATQPEEGAAVAEVLFRVTVARLGSGAGGAGKVAEGDGQMVEFSVPGAGETGAAAEFLGMLKQMRDAGGMACVYTRWMPLTAKSMYADPYRKVLMVWTGNKELEIGVSAPVRPMTQGLQSLGVGASGLQSTGVEEADVHWLAWRGGLWVAIEAPVMGVVRLPAALKAESAGIEPLPPESGASDGDGAGQMESRPADKGAGGVGDGGTASAPATAGGATDDGKSGDLRTSGGPMPAAWEKKGETTIDLAVVTPRQEHSPSGRLLPQAESWWTQPNVDATVVYHYVPLSSVHGVTHGFVVPGMIFDDQHFAVDPGGKVIYVIHDGQLFSLEIPEGAR